MDFAKRDKDGGGWIRSMQRCSDFVLAEGRYLDMSGPTFGSCCCGKGALGEDR